MTKIGEGGGVPSLPSDEVSRREFVQHVDQFQQAMNQYQEEGSPQKKAALKDLMTKQMEMINANIQEQKRTGLRKQGEIVNSDFEQFIVNPTQQNYTALQQDVSTLKDFGAQP